MKPPTQCALWSKPELVYDPNFSEQVEVFGDEEHWTRDLRRCRECGQLYIHDFYEEINFSGGDDWQYVSWVPVETKEDIDALKDVRPYELMRFYPHLIKDAGKAGWIRERRA